MTTFVLVHGAWGRPDDWTEVIDALGPRGKCVVADLPTCRSGTATLADDVAGVTTAAPAREDWIEFGDDGIRTVKPDVEADRVNYSPAAFQRIQARPRRRWSYAAGMATPPHVAWRTTPATYVIARRDTVVTPSLQDRFAARAQAREEFDVDHSIMFEVPGEVAEIVTAV